MISTHELYVLLDRIRSLHDDHAVALLRDLYERGRVERADRASTVASGTQQPQEGQQP